MNITASLKQARVVREVPDPAAALYVHPEWTTQFGWLAQGTTGRPDGSEDMGLFGATPVGILQTRWRALRDALGCTTSVHAKQVHGTHVLWHDVLPAGLVVAFEADGHATTTPCILLCVSIADCVPISILEPKRRAVAVLHAGWRGAAAGMLEAGIARMTSHTGCSPHELVVHLGPAICGYCYEVGPEVAEAFGIENAGGGKAHVDVRRLLTQRALAAGVPYDSITESAWCTRCDDSPFFSHRAGQPERQMAVLGVRG